MNNHTIFPSLEGFEPTRQTLQWYSRAATIIPRAHAAHHPKWWHISLKVRPDGLVTDSMALPNGDVMALKLDLTSHDIVLFTSGGHRQAFSMSNGRTATEMGDALITAVGKLGLNGDYVREKFENDDARDYDPDAASRFWRALVNADRIFKAHRYQLGGQMGPVQLWPHGFDLAFEWFGTHTERYEEHGEIQELPSQLNLGFYPGDPTYFYSNPWPFDSKTLLQHELPAGAAWHTEGWEGTMLPYSELVDDPEAEERLLTFARRVHELAAPTLTADDVERSGK